MCAGYVLKKQASVPEKDERYSFIFWPGFRFFSPGCVLPFTFLYVCARLCVWAGSGGHTLCIESDLHVLSLYLFSSGAVLVVPGQVLSGSWGSWGQESSQSGQACLGCKIQVKVSCSPMYFDKKHAWKARSWMYLYVCSRVGEIKTRDQHCSKACRVVYWECPT